MTQQTEPTEDDIRTLARALDRASGDKKPSAWLTSTS